MKNRNDHNLIDIAIALILFLLIPFVASAQQSQTTQTVTPQGNAQGTVQTNTNTTNSSPSSFSSDGIFSCAGGQYAQSIGSQSATQGVYVPVSDATVELNTGILVYKECILDPIVDQEKQEATEEFAQQALSTIQTGNNGGAYYVRNYEQEDLNASDKGVVAYIKTDNGLSTVNAAFQSQVQNAVVQAYEQATRSPQNDLACPYTGNLQAALNGTPSGSIWDALGALEYPQCNPYFAAELADNAVNAAAAASVQQWQATQYDGFYPTVDANGNIITPAYINAQTTVQAEQSGINQLQMANSIGQMTNALFAGIANTVTAQGIQAGVSQLSQAGAQTQSSLIGSADNAAIAILNSSISAENAYNQAVTAIANLLTSTIGQIRGEENQCWTQVIAAVCKTTPTGNGTCEDASGNTLQIATSTEFSQPVIESQIAPLAQPIATDVQNSDNAIQKLQQIAAGVGGSTSNDVQSEALSQLDQLTSSGALHTSQDVANVQGQEQSVQTSMTNLVQQLATLWTGTDTNNNPTIAWSGSTSSPQGWCNVGNPSSNTAAAQTISEWDALWKKS